MAPSLLIFFFFFFPCSCISDHVHLQCPSKFTCRGLHDDVHFPFSNTSYPDCGLIILNCSEEHDVRVQFSKPHGTWYIVERSSNTEIVFHDEILKDQLNSNDCNSLNNFTLPLSSSIVFQFKNPLLPFFKCKRGYSNSSHPNLFKNLKNYTRCSNSNLYFSGDHEKSLPSLPENCSDFCSVVQLPAVEWDPSKAIENLMSLWSFTFILKWEILPECNNCYKKGGLCLNNSDGSFKCSGSWKQDNKKATKIGVGIAGGVGGILLTCVAFFIYQRRRKLRSISSTLLSQTISSEPSSKPDLENGSMFHLTPIFKYDELVEATENFHSSKELGDGGFGTVYYGKLQDGRVVAVKRLYEHNYKRVEQFMNEIKILSLLRHPHLVFLYGCTSHDSRELLLVYEYVPNGTVADHLHGQRAKSGSLPWPVRMNIAIETADALAYLHATDIIHRDVKTTNILLDNNFHVKVADFGLSRLFPNDATHVSTAPQGTPGYVDPEYYQCYQLNSKSDVYSFGVVLIELISSKPAVDISRHRHEINLANMAVNKILNHALHELVDPNLGFESDYTVRRMITLVAELAFRCLQQEKEMRPTMKEVLECLKTIQSDEHTIENRDELDVGAEKGLLKGMNPPFSPNSVTDKWASVSTTPNTSA